MKRTTYKSEKKFFILSSYLILAVLFFSSAVTAKSSSLSHSHRSTAAKNSQKPDPKLQELREKLNHFADSVRFQYDSTVLPTASIRALDQIIQIMREYDGAYQYLIRIHSYENGKSADYMFKYSQNRGNAIRMYLIHQGVLSKNLLVQGMGSSDRKCFDEAETDCYAKNNRLEMDVRQRDQEDDNGELSGELTRLASRLRFSTHGALFQENDDIVEEMADYMKQSNSSYNLIVHAYDTIAPEYFNVALCETKGESLKFSLGMQDIAPKRLHVVPKGNAQYQWTGNQMQFLVEICEIRK